MERKLLIMPGLGSSGIKHWQSFWAREMEHAVWLEQEHWDEPKLDQWLKKLNETILMLDCPIILVAHSLSVSLVAHWAAKYKNTNIKGALLVAPADVDSSVYTPEVVRNFAPIPITKLPFPSIVIASENDAYVSLERAIYFAKQWGSDFVNIGSKGHINSDSDLGLWEEGQLILKKFASKLVSSQN